MGGLSLHEAMAPPLLSRCDCSHAFSLACRAASATCNFCVPCLMGTVGMGWWLSLHTALVSAEDGVKVVGHKPALGMRDSTKFGWQCGKHRPASMSLLRPLPSCQDKSPGVAVGSDCLTVPYSLRTLPLKVALEACQLSGTQAGISLLCGYGTGHVIYTSGQGPRSCFWFL